jgi:hypothetical protein
MITTEKKYWQNGYQIRGGHFKSLALSFLNLAIMFCWTKKERGIITISFYKLV